MRDYLPPLSTLPVHAVDLREIKRRPAEEGALDEQGGLRVLSYSFWQSFTQAEITHFCVNHGFYCIPTIELVHWLMKRIDGRKAIEIGAGNGVLAERLGIVATDSKQQLRPEIREWYQSIEQAIVPYGPNVKPMDAVKAVRALKPKVVVAAWVTHLYRESEHEREGNEFGIAEEKIIAEAEYIHIGNRHVHRHKPVLDYEHEEFEFPWLVSRALADAPNFIAVWQKKAKRR